VIDEGTGNGSIQEGGKCPLASVACEVTCAIHPAKKAHMIRNEGRDGVDVVSCNYNCYLKAMVESSRHLHFKILVPKTCRHFVEEL